MSPAAKRWSLVALVVVGGVGSMLAFRFAGVGSATPDLRDPQRVAAGKPLYDAHCAACHGANLEGQPNWKSRLPSGRMPAPPHDDSGHTWHHANVVLFELIKFGLKPPNAPAGYQSDMPAFGGSLSDEQIWNVLAFIQSRWSDRVRGAHAELEARHRQRQ
jgi:mono/diheme cytochrome c family protein